jgi:hypothetical protein
MNALILRIILIAGFVLLLGGLAAGGWWMQGQLAAQVINTDHARTDSELVQLDLEKLRHVQRQLEEQKDVVDRADLIAATAVNYKYQDQVVSDLQAYSGRHGIEISGFDFSKSNAPGPKVAGPAGTTRTPFSISLKGPIAYDKFMEFLRDIENNLTKLQVSSLSLTPSPTDAKQVDNPSISLIVYLKK